MFLNQNITLFCLCFCFKDAFLIYILDSLTLDSGPRAMELMPEQSLPKTCVFSIGHVTAFLHLWTPDSISALHVGGILNREISNRTHKNVIIGIWYRLWKWCRYTVWVGEGSGNPLQYSCLEISMARGAWQTTNHGSQKLRRDWVTNTHIQYESWNKAVCGHQFSSVHSLSCVWLFATPWIAARQASLSITNSRSSPRLTSIESVMPSSHLILCRPLVLLPPIPPSIRVFSNESTLRIRWPKYWSFSFSIIPSKEIPELSSFRMDWLDLLAVQGTLKSLLQHHSSKASIYVYYTCICVYYT